ncbi:uncharacterized protein Z518_00785 [Rhinocladiella mackenziei CBS 650.93]|uniref:Uncharacterized protein n=1 Tax=Rhinocladiella mackenziei CBS 650.93 TaxID=1442369 RepID=A0A0D2IUG0_9EURO|nr:uncharacterized protein Z518_00785 [Rhinocladiella mackenziei CBS 650.93]KIX09704.1 hypothetical protein Z518_00785 [Rhinocladiella mackenziei CBS 650.93]
MSASDAASQNQTCPSPLSPRQKFQADVRTLSDHGSSAPRNASSSRRSPELQHVSSLRVQPIPPQDISQPNPIYRFSDSALDSARDVHRESPFTLEEREAWNRPSPVRTRKGISEDVFILQPPQEDSPIPQPSKPMRELQSFAPCTGHTDINERPKTSRGLNPGQSSRPTSRDHTHEGRDQNPRNSKFAEGSMNERSAGISSTWLEHGSISSLSGTESDNEPLPRASPQRSSVDLEEFQSAPAASATLPKRLFKIGSAFKSNENATKPETEPQPATTTKKKGLRKSMSMWSIHNIGEKMKTFGGSTNDLTAKAASPTKKAFASGHANDIDVLNDRKRRAEETGARELGVKRRKSDVSQPSASNEQGLKRTLVAAPCQSLARYEGKTPPNKTRLSRSSSTIGTNDLELADNYSDLDRHRRPTRRELEIENQQLRAMLRQQQEDARQKGSVSQETSSSTNVRQPQESGRTPASSPRRSSAQKQSQKPSGKDVPPVPPIPDRIALKNLSNTRNQPRNDNSNTNVNSNSNMNRNSSSDPMTKTGLRSAAGLPRSVSMILEEDEEGVENKGPGSSPGRCPRDLEMEKITVQEQIALQMKGVKREPWEWPDDVF